MKSYRLALCIVSSIITSHQLQAMDDDNAIPLKKISRKPISLQQQFISFEQKLSKELNEDDWLMKKELLPNVYIEKLHSELPEIFESERTIEKFYRIQNSCLAEAINELITNYGYNHYKNVTGNTLANIRNSKERQPCPILNELPFYLKHYIMQKAYNSIKQKFICAALSTKSEVFDIHAAIESAAVIDRDSKKFQIWNLKTGKLTLEIPDAFDDSLIRFSGDGSMIITTSLASKDPIKTCIVLRNIKNKKRLMEFTYNNHVQNVFFKNSTLSIFNKTGEVYLTTIDIQNKTTNGKLEIKAGVEKMNPPFTFQWKYHVDNNAILRKSFSYFMCTQAAKNSLEPESLRKIYDTPFYKSLSLTDDQRKMIHYKIESKLKKLEASPNSTMSLFG